MVHVASYLYPYDLPSAHPTDRKLPTSNLRMESGNTHNARRRRNTLFRKGLQLHQKHNYDVLILARHVRSGQYYIYTSNQDSNWRSRKDLVIKKG